MKLKRVSFDWLRSGLPKLLLDKDGAEREERNQEPATSFTLGDEKCRWPTFLFLRF